MLLLTPPSLRCLALVTLTQMGANPTVKSVLLWTPCSSPSASCTCLPVSCHQVPQILMLRHAPWRWQCHSQQFKLLVICFTENLTFNMEIQPFVDTFRGPSQSLSLWTPHAGLEQFVAAVYGLMGNLSISCLNLQAGCEPAVRISLTGLLLISLHRGAA